MKYRIVLYLFVFLSLTGAIFSCSPQPCQDETLAPVIATFYQTGTGKMVAVDSVTLYGLGKEDDPVYLKKENIQTILIPLNAGSDTSKFFIKVNTYTDTITFVYKSFPHLVSKECGYTFFHVIDTICNTNADIDLVTRSVNVTTTYEENVRIFI